MSAMLAAGHDTAQVKRPTLISRLHAALTILSLILCIAVCLAWVAIRSPTPRGAWDFSFSVATATGRVAMSKGDNE
jgi:hypothetical protein